MVMKAFSLERYSMKSLTEHNETKYRWYLYFDKAIGMICTILQKGKGNNEHYITETTKHGFYSPWRHIFKCLMIQAIFSYIIETINDHVVNITDESK